MKTTPANSRYESGSPGRQGNEDVAVEQAPVADADGMVIRPKFSIGEFGWTTFRQDTEGSMFGLNSMKPAHYIKRPT